MFPSIPQTAVMPSKRAAGFLVLAVVLSAQTGCSYFRKRNERAILQGKALFELHCCGCHNGKSSSLGKNPPSLSGIFRRPTLPSGAPATDAQVRSTVLEGRSGIMPSFSNTLSDEEIGNIIRYLHTAGPETPLCGTN
jgi:mono/diheme cytochrome c family protein